MATTSESSINSASLSIKNQTKEKFDALLRAAKKARTSKSQEQLLLDQDESYEMHEMGKSQTRNFILNKFFDETVSQESQATYDIVNEVGAKPPIPKPRTRRTPHLAQSPQTSQRTFDIVASPKSVSSNKTYDLEKIEPVDSLSEETRSKSVKSDEVAEGFNSPEDIPIVENSPTKNSTYNYNKLTEIIIHKTERLLLNSMVVHPVVKIHIVDIASGRYFPKSDTTRAVVFFYENIDNEYISPVMTHTFNLQEKRILYPSWKEAILLNEDFQYFENERENIILFFEILDFVSPSSMHQAKVKDYTKGWHKIAFAFLKLAGKQSQFNVGKEIKLQLYHPRHAKNKDPHFCELWTWWKRKKLERYPSALTVTIKSIVSPMAVAESFRSKTPMQRESSSRRHNFESFKKEENKEENSVFAESVKSDFLKETPWKRTIYEEGQIPDKCATKLDSGDEGCFVMSFSNNGLYLAYAIYRNNIWVIIIYSVLLSNEVTQLISNQGFIYALRWFQNDKFLICASADNTITIFKLSSSSICQMLPHPSYVYSCDISLENTIISGCYDGIIRIWTNSVSDLKKIDFHLFQELESHTGYITSLVFTKNLNILSGDSKGLIIEWQKEENGWILKREIHLLDLRETTINHMILFYKDKKMLILSRDNIIRIIDVKSGCILQWLKGASIKRQQTFCSVSSCGTLVYCGSDNGFVHVWNVKTGQELTRFAPYSDNLLLTISCVAHHGFDNIIAISHFGKSLPILVYKVEYDKENDNNFRDAVVVKNEVERRAKPISGSFSKISCKRILHKMDEIVTLHNVL